MCRNSSPHGSRKGSRWGLELFRRLVARGPAAIIAVVLITFLGANAATAYWQSFGTGSATAVTGTLAAPTNVTVPANSSPSVSVAWTASAGTLAPSGYYVTRTTGGTTAAACGSSPAALVAGTSCADAGVPLGAYTYTVTAVYRSWTAVSAASGSVTVATANKVVFSAQPTNVTAGLAITPAVKVAVQTAAGAAVPTANIQVTVAIGTNPGGGTLSGTATALTDSSGVATFTTLSINKAGTGYTLTASSAGLTSTTSSSFTVSAAAASKLVVTSAALSGVASAGATLGPLTVQRQDVYGNPVTAGSTTVTLGSASAGTAVFAATSGGPAITSVTIGSNSSTATLFYGDTKAGSPLITVSSTGLTPFSQNANVSAAAAAKLVFGQQPTNTAKGQTIAPVTVLIVDQFGNLTANTDTVLVDKTVKLGNLFGTVSKAAVAGVATFSDLSINPAGTYALVATSGTLTSATSVDFTSGG